MLEMDFTEFSLSFQLYTMKETHHANWTVAWICCFLTFLLLGFARLSGLLFVAVMEYYGVSRSAASLPFVLCYTVRNVAGPLIGYLSRRWGSHTVSIIGCVLSTLGVGFCFFANDIITVTILWGGVFGLGLGLSTILIPEVLRQHFTASLSKANGIAFGGECIAGLILPPLFEVSLEKYGTQGTFLILSALLLNSVPAALFLSKIKPHDDFSHEYIKGATTSKYSGTVPATKTESKKNKVYSSSYQDYSSKKTTQISDNECCPSAKNLSYSSNNIYYSTNNPHYSPTANLHNMDCFQIPLIDSQYNSCKNASEIKTVSLSLNQTAPASVKNSALKSFTVFLDPTFIIILIIQSLYIYIATTALTIVVDFSQDIGVETYEEIYIVMGMSVSDMVGRFGLGFITDSGYMSRTAFSALSFTVMGLLFLASVWVKGFVLLMATMLPFCLLAGGLLIVFPPIVSEFVEEDKVTMALASRMSLYGPLSLSQSPLIGFFRGKLGSYDGVFYTLTILSFLCSGLTVLTPFAARRRDQRKVSKQPVPETKPILEKDNI